MPRTILTNLDRLPAGCEALVERISGAGALGGFGRRGHRGGWRHGGSGGQEFASAVEERLAALGFVPGARLAVQSNYGRGPVIVTIRGAHVAVGRGQAHRILVRPSWPGIPEGTATAKPLSKTERPVGGE
ncbi:MAG: FeoA family protein [Bacillota bacterium]|nr:FeoA family protein [Bacillota bacterium]